MRRKLLLLFGAAVMTAPVQAQPGAVPPPASYHRTVKRSVEGKTPFALLVRGKPAFAVWPAGPDLVLRTAAADFARYFRERWGAAPGIAARLPARGNVIVLASVKPPPPMPEPLMAAANAAGELGEQAFVITRVPLGGGRVALLCLGGSPVAARWAGVELLRRMRVAGGEAAVEFDRLYDEPYFTYRAVYINDSAHQVNNYSPNLIHNVPTFRWPLEKWKRYIDQMAFFRYNVLTIWIVPNLFSPEVFSGGGAFDYFRDTMRAVAQYARPRGVQLCLLNAVNVAVGAGTRLDTLPVYKSLPMYTYLSPLKPAEKELNLRLWDYWSKAIPEVDIWEFFPGDPGGCHEEGCGPEGYVDLALELTAVIRRNNPRARVDFTPWQFFGWGPTWPTMMRKDTARVDRGYEYLMRKLDAFPPDAMFSPNLNDHTSAPPVEGGGWSGGGTVKYIEGMSAKHLVHTWTYFVTEGEGWVNHHYRVPDIIRQRDVEARYPISGGLCYTMTPELNILNQFACAESFWDPRVTQQEIMERYGNGIFGNAERRLLEIFPSFNVSPTVGYTFAGTPKWKPDYAGILRDMTRNRAVLESIVLPSVPRFDILPSPKQYAAELIYYTRLYDELCRLGLLVEKARTLVRAAGRDTGVIRMADARAAIARMDAAPARELSETLDAIERLDVPAMKARFQRKHYQIFIDAPNEFTKLLPGLINGFFNAFGADFVS